MRGEAGVALTCKKLASAFHAEMINMNELKHLNRSVGQNTYHLIWKPKWSHSILTGSVRNCCFAAIKMVSNRHKMRIIEMEIMPDHIHCFLELKPDMSICKAFQLLKGYSSKKIFEHFPKLRKKFTTGHLWSPGKFFRSVGSVTSEAIKHYISHSNRQQLERYPVL